MLATSQQQLKQQILVKDFLYKKLASLGILKTLTSLKKLSLNSCSQFLKKLKNCFSIPIITFSYPIALKKRKVLIFLKLKDYDLSNTLTYIKRFKTFCFNFIKGCNNLPV